MTAGDDERVAARAEYVRNQQAVAANAAIKRRRSPFAVGGLIGVVVTAGLFVATVVGYYNDPQQQGATNVVLSAATSIATIATLWMVVLPYLIEVRPTGARVRNIALLGLLTAVLVPLGTPLFVAIGSLVAGLAYDLSH